MFFIFVGIVVNWFITDALLVSSIYVCDSSVDFRKFFFAINFTACNILAFLRHFNITSHTANTFFALMWYDWHIKNKINKIQSRRAAKFRLWLFMYFYSSAIVEFSYLHISLAHSWKHQVKNSLIHKKRVFILLNQRNQSRGTAKQLNYDEWLVRQRT